MGFYKKHIFAFFLGLMIWGVGISAAHACGTNTNPSGVEGQIIYNEDYNVPQYCDGTDWIAMNGGYLNFAIAPTTGLIGYWPMDASSGNIIDNTASGNDGTPSGTGTITYAVTGKIGDAITLPGNNSSRFDMDNPPELQITGVITVSAWINRSTTAEQDYIISKRGGSPDRGYRLIAHVGGTVSFEISSDGTLVQSSGNSTSTTTTGEWFHVAAVFEPSTRISIYVNGVKENENTTSIPASIFNSTRDFQLGGDFGSGNYGGSLDDIRVYNVALTDAEVAQLYSATGGTPIQATVTKVVPNGLIAHWRLDETTGTTAFDSSGNGYDGTLEGGLTFNNDSQSGIINRSLKFVDQDPINPDFDHYITLSPRPPISSSDVFSITGWLYAEPTTSQGRAWRGGSSAILATPGQPISYAGVSPELTSSTIVKEKQWYHYGVTFDPILNNYQLYINGNREDSNSGTPDTFPEVIRGISWSFGGMDGQQDDIRLYDRVLTEDEISEIYNARDGIRYNANQRKMEYFDGNGYVSMTPEWTAPTSGLIAHYKLDETSGTTAVDETGNYDLTYSPEIDTTIDSTIGPVGGAIDFINSISGEAGSGALTNFQDLDTFTVTGWVRLADTTQQGGIMALSGQTPGTDFIFDLKTRFNGATIEFDAYRWSLDWGIWRTNNSLTLGEWTHVAVVYSFLDAVGTEPEIYLNGVLQTVNEIREPLGTYDASTADSIILVGRRGNATSDNWRGALDDVRLYDRKLSAAEITQLYNMGTPAGSSTALPQGCPNIGDVCDDGTIYAGFTPEDGTTLMFVAPKDAPAALEWNNNNTTGIEETFQTSFTTGETNTLEIIQIDADNVSGGFQPHRAAQYCYDLTDYGSSDWYLPAFDELGEFDNILSEANISNDPDGYWSSTEVSSTAARGRQFSTMGNLIRTKHADLLVRCVRKGPAPRCANPYGLEGEMFYNEDEDVAQYCDGARWIGIGKYN